MTVRTALALRLGLLTSCALLAAGVTTTIGCQGIEARLELAPLSEQAVIPRPDSVADAEGNVFFSELERVRFVGGADRLAPRLARRLATGTDAAAAVDTNLTSDLNWLLGAGLRGEIAAGDAADERAISLRPDTSLGPESYRLTVLPKGIDLYAADGAGFYYGLQTLRQLVERSAGEDGRVACGTILDGPRYRYRGVMVDIARHFHGPPELRRVIDLLARYKMNALHLHLADDQGWRIEIKSRPLLTEVGGSTQVGGAGGGFLTQDDYRALVAYAAARYVTIVPEIDMPGHTNAALASYPELTCDGVAPPLYEGTEVGFSTFCIGKPEVMAFVTDVFTELAAMTPGPYLHVGGDESHATDSADYRTFMREVVPVVRGLGKRAIGWDEIVTADVAPGVIAQWWASQPNAEYAVARGHELIVSPAKYAYLDMQYDSTSRVGLHWAAYIEVDQGYRWDPAEVAPGITDADILGVEAPLWSETVVTREDLDYLIFPRMLGYAEIAWTRPARRDWAEYRTRLATEGRELDALGVGYYRSPTVAWEKRVEPTTD